MSSKPKSETIVTTTTSNTQTTDARSTTGDPDLWDAIPMGQTVKEAFAGKKAPSSVPIAKPGKSLWFYIHPNTEWRREALLIESGDMGKEWYAIDEDVAIQVEDLISHRLLVPCSSLQGNWFLWPVKVSDRSGRLDAGSESTLRVVTDWAGHWVRITWNPDLRAYDVHHRKVDKAPPADPEGGYKSLWSRAFRGRFIEDSEHPVIAAILGAK